MTSYAMLNAQPSPCIAGIRVVSQFGAPSIARQEAVAMFYGPSNARRSNKAAN